MKYLTIIFLVICSVTVLTIYWLQPDPGIPLDEVALSVNGRKIAEKTILALEQKSGYHQKERTDVYDTVITRELLIQQAQEQKIDQEESFRTALKEYYENSLIKILLERRNSELTVQVSEADIERYLKLRGTTVTFTRLDSIPTSTNSVKGISGESMTSAFDDLAEPLRLLISTLSPGEFGIRFDTGNERYAIRLDQAKASESGNEPFPPRDHVRDMLENFLREQAMNKWIADLNASAEITIYNDKKGP